MTNRELIKKYEFNKKRALEILFFLSQKVKNLEKYIEFKNQKIDFDSKTFQDIFASLKTIERITGKVYFLEKEFSLFKGVFCPREETELLTNKLIEKSQKLSKCKYIDICSGAGVIGISVLLKNPNLKGYLLDISEEATQNIKENLAKHQVTATVIKDDWLNHLKKSNYEIISANFPYIGEDDPIDKSLTENDPKISLFAKENGWYHYRKILEFLRKNKNWKIIALECSKFHEDKWLNLKYRGWKIEVFRDFNKVLRVVIIENLLYMEGKLTLN